MIMKLNTFLSVVLLALTIGCYGQDSMKCNEKYFNDRLLDKLIGQWSLTGIIGKRGVENRFSAQWVLNHEFIELNLVDSAAAAPYMAKVLIGYDCLSERYIMHWFDNLSGRYSETLGFGIKAGQSIQFK